MALIQVPLSLFGISGIGGIITSLLNKRKEIEFRRLGNMGKRYKSWLKGS